MGGWAIQEIMQECSGRTAGDPAILAACGCKGKASPEKIASAEADAGTLCARALVFVFRRCVTQIHGNLCRTLYEQN